MNVHNQKECQKAFLRLSFTVEIDAVRLLIILEALLLAIELIRLLI